MKLLSNEQQTDLQQLLEEISNLDIHAGLKASLNYWSIELKPKRIRKKKQESVDTTVEA